MYGKCVSLSAEIERPGVGEEGSLDCGQCLAELMERLPALGPLRDFECADPRQIARQVGMVYPLEEDGDADLAEIDFGPDDWFEPAAGLSVVRLALNELRTNPGIVADAVYDPRLSAADAVRALEGLQALLVSAQQQETRFHLRLVEAV